MNGEGEIMSTLDISDEKSLAAVIPLLLYALLLHVSLVQF
jgi:hypothetical protein